VFLVTNLNFEEIRQLADNNSETGATAADQPQVLSSGKTIFCDSKSYIPAGMVAKEFNYALSHVSLLARQKRIDAIWNGKRWYVNRDSVIEHRKLSQRNKVAGGLKSQYTVLSSVLSLSSQSSLGNGGHSSSSKNNLFVSRQAEEHLSKRANLLKTAIFALSLGGLLISGGLYHGILKFDENILKNKSADILDPVRNFFKKYLLPQEGPETYLVIDLYKLREGKVKEQESRIAALEQRLAFGLVEGGPPQVGQAPSISSGQARIIREIVSGPSTVDLSQINGRIDNALSLIEANRINLSSLAGDFNSFQRITPTVYQLPSTNTSGIGPITLNPDTLDVETLNVSRNSILSGALSVLSDFSINTNAFKVDASNNRAGIGTSSLETALEVVGTASISSNLYALGNVGVGTTTPTSKLNVEGGRLEVGGTASASYFLTGNTLQVGGFSSVSYNRFGTSTTGHSNYISASNDVLISGDLETRGTASFGGVASISGNLYVFGDIGIGTSNTSAELTVTGSGSFTGRLTATRNPTQAHTGTWPSFTNTDDSTLYINPSSPVADGNVIAYTNGSDPKFLVDAEGDVYIAGNLTLVGTTTQATTAITGDLNVEGNSRLGDAQTDTIKLSGTIQPRTLTSFPVLVKASTSQTVDVFRILDTNDNILLTLDQGTGLFTASSGFNFALGGSTATVSYSRLGTATTTHSSDIDKFNDLLIAGSLETDGNAFFDSKASISSNLQISGRFIADTAASHSFAEDLRLTGSSPTLGVNAGNYMDSVFEVGGTASISGATTLRGVTYTWPSADGTNNQVLKTNGSGTLSWGVGVASNTLDFDEIVNTMTLDANLTITPGAFKIGIGSAPSTLFEVQGTSSASYGLFGALQIAGFSSQSYSRFGTDTTGYTSDLDASNDLLISGALEVNGNSFFDGKASISGNFQTAGRFIFGDNGDTGEINTSDWDISSTGALTGIGSITADGVLTVDDRAEFQGTASASYLLTGNTLQVGGYSSAAYSRFGTDTTGYSNFITTTNDLLISGDLEVNATANFDGNLRVGTSTTPALFVQSGNANVGIGTTVPGSKLHVYGADIDAKIESSGASDTELTLKNSAAEWSIYNEGTTGSFIFYKTGAGSLVGITVDGNLAANIGIGTTVPEALLEVQGGNTIDAVFVLDADRGDDNADTWTFKSQASDNDFTILNHTSELFRITDSGLVGIGTTTPSSLLTVQGRGEFQGTASASYLLTGNTLQVGGYSSAAYSRFGTSTTGHSNYISASNDLLISGDLEVKGTASFAGVASISGVLAINNVRYTWPSADGTNLYLKSNGSGTLSWATAGGVTSNSLDFDEFVDSMTLDANLTIASAGYTFTITDATTTIGGATFHTGGNVGIGVATPTTKFQVTGNASVSGNFEITGNIIPTSQASVSATSQTITTVDDTGVSHNYVSTAIGTDGFPVISYQRSSDLYVAKCGNAACSSGNTLTAVDTTDDVGQYTSIAIGTDGFPVISYYDVTNTALKLVKCGNAACSSGNTITSVVSTANDDGSFSSIAIGTDGLAIIAYYDATVGDLETLKCGNATCSSGNTNSQVDSTDDVGKYTSIKIGADGLPVIAYYDVTNGDLEVTKCGNMACSSGNVTSTPDSTGNVGSYTQMAIGQDGLPLIVYTTADSNIKAIKCTNNACTAGTITIVDSNLNPIYNTSVAIGPDGLPIIVASDAGNLSLVVNKCGNASCSAGPTRTVFTRTGGDVGRPSPVIAPDGLPFIVFNEASAVADLFALKCALPGCSQTSGGGFNATGSDIGGIGVFFRNVYAAQYWGKKFQIANFDVAENYEVVGPVVDAGDIVSVASKGGPAVEKSIYGGKTILGIVSSQPAIVLGEWDEGKEPSRSAPVALQGRVPVKVVSENGMIKAGDRITLSKTMPGYGMKQTEAGQSVGIALENQMSDRGKILIFVNLSFWMPDVKQLTTDNLQLTTDSNTYNISAIASGLLIWFKDSLHIVFEDGLLKVARIVTDKLTTKEFCLEEVCINKGQFRLLLEKNGIYPQIDIGPAISNTPEPSVSTEPSSSPTPSSSGMPGPSETPDSINSPQAEPSPSATPETSAEPVVSETPPPTPVPSLSSTPEPTPLQPEASEPEADPTPEPTPDPTPISTPETTPEPSPAEDLNI